MFLAYSEKSQFFPMLSNSSLYIISFQLCEICFSWTKINKYSDMFVLITDFYNIHLAWIKSATTVAKNPNFKCVLSNSWNRKKKAKKKKKKKNNKGNIKSECKLWLIFNVKLMVDIHKEINNYKNYKWFHSWKDHTENLK